MNLLVCLLTVCGPPVPQPERKPQNREALSVLVAVLSPTLEQCLAWSEYPLVLAEWMNILGAPCRAGEADHAPLLPLEVWQAQGDL